MSRIFENCKEAINEIERDIMEMGVLVHPHSMQNKIVKDNDDFSTLEVQNYSFSILNTKDKDDIISKDSKKWVFKEFQERVSTVEKLNPGTAWTLRKEVWEEFLNKKGEFCYSYHDRMNGYEQINFCIKELKKNPDTRQAIVHVHYPQDTSWMQKRRIPCSIYYQFMIRNGKLDVIYNMRSSDFYSHFKNDIWLADELRKWIAKEVGVETGIFHMNVGSLHAYKNYGGEHKHIF